MEGGGKQIKWVKRIKWRGVERSGVNNPGGQQAIPVEH